MVNKVIWSLILISFWSVTQAQKAKVQTAWRSLSDYEETLKDGKPTIAYLVKAKEAIDLALANEDTKKQGKTHAYKLRISYAFFQYNLNAEISKLEASIPDRNERILKAYGNTSLEDFESAVDELNQIKELDPKFLETIQQGLVNSSKPMDDDEMKFALVVQQMKIEAANIASGKYQVKKYNEAADYFYKTAIMNTILYKTTDTVNFYNACISSAKAENTDKIIEYNKKMIDAKISSPLNYEELYAALLSKGDSAAAYEMLRKGRQAFPNDGGLLTQETNLFLAQGKQEDALRNLKISIEKDPTNALYYFIIGNIYDNMANPKDKVTGKELERPANFKELFKNAEDNYQKAIDLNPKNQEYLYNSLYNLGAMYNNYGGSIANSTSEKGGYAAKAQKENEAKAQEY
ncbi:MAG: hypothetical protein PSX36_03285, partial [bacterium]|nr:hypothetical protein [bacterium]